MSTLFTNNQVVFCAEDDNLNLVLNEYHHKHWTASVRLRQHVLCVIVKYILIKYSKPTDLLIWNYVMKRNFAIFFFVCLCLEVESRSCQNRQQNKRNITKRQTKAWEFLVKPEVIRFRLYHQHGLNCIFIMTFLQSCTLMCCEYFCY